MPAKTISHCQGKGSIPHNNREFTFKNVDPERTSDNIIYIQQPLDEAYEECFGEALARYNEKQTRADRCIDDYYTYLFNRAPKTSVATSANKQKSFYETLVQIGTMYDSGVGSSDGEIAARCLDEYMKGFKERNPNLYVFNAVLHLDEATPHLHIDYIPIGHYKRGMDTQNGIAQALREMGYGGGKDAINRWRIAERKVLENICRDYGVDVSEPKKSRGYSLTPDEYKEQLAIEKDSLIAEVYDDVAAEKDELLARVRADVEVEKEKLAKLAREFEDKTAEKLKLDDDIKRANTDIKSIKAIKESLIDSKNSLIVEVEKLEKEIAPIRELRKLKTTTEEIVLPEPQGLGKNKTVRLTPENAAILKKQANSYIANHAEIVSIRQRNIAAKKREDAVSDREKTSTNREHTITDKENALKQQEIIISRHKKEVDMLYDRQAGINEVLEHTERERDGLRKLLAEEIEKGKSLEVITATSQAHSKDLTERLRGAYESLASVIKAVGMLKYDNNDGYGIPNLTSKQAKLIDGLADYGAKWANAEGYTDLVEDIQKYIGISKGIQNIIEPPERRRERGMELGL